MTVDQLRTWIRSWVAQATGVDPEEIIDSKPLETFGLSSRDAVVLSGELENLLGIHIDATIAYEYPTIAQLADRLVGELVNPAHGAAAAAQPAYQPGRHGETDIAVIGMAGRFPGAENTAELWDLLVAGRSATGPLPEGRWSEYLSDPVLGEKMARQPMTGGYLSDISSFDPEFFGLSPLEATNMDPQQRILLELAWAAMEDAGTPANELRGASVGVYMGSTNNDYGMIVAADPAEAHPYILTGASSSIIPNRLSYAFDFRGPSVNVDTACSSSLVSLHHAIRGLRDGEADIALAGGVNIQASPFITTSFGELGVISPTGAIHAFSDDADGFVRADAAGVLVLKRLSDAQKSGDRILAVLRGSATNSDGHSNGLTAPNPDAQVDVLRRAYADAGIDPASVDYIEAHGTGTILGDPIEASALGKVLGPGRTAATPTLLGSVKSNIGHSESAAGVVGVIKVIEAMRHGVIPPSVNFTEPNRFIDFDAEHLEVVEDPREWPEYSGRKIAGVSGFGFGGTNAHVVISDYRPDLDGATHFDEPQLPGHDLAELLAQSPQQRQADDSYQPPLVALPISGMMPSRRRAAAAHMADFLEATAPGVTGNDPAVDQDFLLEVARELAARNHGRSRAVVLARTVDEAVRRLRQVAEGISSVGSESADSPSVIGPVFVYSGFGSQHRLMAKDLLAASPVFAQRLAQLDEIVQFEGGWSVLELIADDERTYDTETAQVAITAIQIALTDLLAHAGIRPAGVMGMSMGEIAAAYAAGGLTDRDAMVIATHRARLMGEGEASLTEETQGAMAVVELSAEEIAQLDGAIEPAVYAGPGMTTVGGPRAEVLDLVAQLEADGKFARALDVKGAGHTSAIEPLLGELAGEIGGIAAQPLHTTLYSSVDRGEVYRPGAVVHDSEYWLRMTRQAVYFQDATEAALAHGHHQLVEIAPNPVALMGMMNTAFSVAKPDTQLLFALKRKVDAGESLLELAAKLYVTGVPVQFTKLLGASELRRVYLPHTQFRRQRYWTTARPQAGSTRLPGARISLPDGTIAFGIHADQVPSSVALVELAAAAVYPDASLSAFEEYDELLSGEVTTLVRRSLGGLSVQVYAGEPAVLMAEGFASVSSEPIPVLPGVSSLPEPPASPGFADDTDIAAVRWDPATETVEERLAAIVSESMGYDVSDLPRELPLIDLGLDSLMGMRIKNRVENDFQIPPLQVQELRDASLADVIAKVEDAVHSSGGLEDNSLAQRLEDLAEPAAETNPAQQTEPVQHNEPAQQEAAPAAGVGVAPRDASERMVFGTWAGIVGKAPAGVTSQLPEITEALAQEIALRLSDRAGIEITPQQVAEATTLEPLADLVREGLETEVEGNIRVLREAEGPALFMFHPAGGTTVVYQPLTRRLDESIAVYGIERTEGTLEERAASYIDDILAYARGRKIILGGWSFGGALAYEVAYQLAQLPPERWPAGTKPEVPFIALLDTTQPSEPAPDTLAETKARWERYSAFAKKTYGLDIPVPYELLETAGEDAVMDMLAAFLATTDAAEHGLAAGVLEHQRASFVDNQILSRLDMTRWELVDVPVLLFRAERMHDGAIELEPRYADIDPDGGWGVIVRDLEIVQLPGDHLAVPDEPAIGIVAKHISQWIAEKGR